MSEPLPNPLPLARALAKLSRPQNIVYSGALAALSSYLFTESFPVSVSSYFFIFLLYAVSATYNNLKDIRTDTINHRTDNPLINKGLSRGQAQIFLAAAVLFLICTQLLLSQPSSLLIACLYMLLLYLYSGRPNFKSQSWLGVIILAVCYGGLPIILGYAQSDPSTYTKILIGSALNSLVLLPILLAKDYKDVKGDRATGIRTPLVTHGPKTIRVVALTISLLASLCLWQVIGGIAHLLIYTPLAALYVVYTYYLHARKGNIQPIYAKAGTIILLLMSLSIVWSIH